ncbi:MAG: hypothetical protein FWH24_01555 [Oscillospiraceae bacterium]|nr:hypothetical protein [Oscillospiraceae bacterium]
MPKYAVLQNPGHNRVYFGSSGSLAKNELCALFPEKLDNIAEESFGGVGYITFKSGGLSEHDLILLSRLSFVYAIFEVTGGKFIPIQKNHSYFFSDDLNTVLKYSGKTNELFTRMMINLAVCASGFRDDFLEPLNLLDPVCGKGTAVFDGLICGYNSYGIEISEKLTAESARFFKKYLELGKYKHSYKKEKISGSGFKSQRHFFETAKNKSDQKTDKTLSCEFVCGDSANANKYYKKNFFNIIAGDLPYGIQHDNSAFGNKMRSPAELLGSCLPAWLEVLKPGGVIILAWNTFLLKRDRLEDIFAERQLEIINSGDFSHRVDQAIMRDVIIGKKPQK